MRGCAISLLLGLAGLLATGGAVLALLVQILGIDAGAALMPSLAAGCLLWIAINLVRAALQSAREKKAIAAGLAGAPPVDGRQAVLAGRLEAQGETLVGPFDGRPALVYAYEVRRDIGSGKSRRLLTFYKGVGLAPCRILTATGGYQLLAMPEFVGSGPLLTMGEMLPHAERYLATVPFRETKRSELEERWTDDDGSYRADISFVKGQPPPDLSACTLDQHRAGPGDQVCLIGRYSAARGGIVPDPNWGRATRLLLGNPQEAAATLGSQVRNRLILAVLFTAAAGGLLVLFLPGSG